jgi:hypothetical protein
MAGTTPQPPLTINQLINDLKLLPGDWHIKVSNSDGEFYLSDLIIEEDCIVSLVLKPIPCNE